jgi:hypothetical protein
LLFCEVAETLLVTDGYAHNDYLQSLAELGLVGFLIVATLIAAVLFHAIRAAARDATPDGPARATACVASIAAILLHSTVDFNLYIPASALVLAWISAIASAAMFSSAPIPAANAPVPLVREITCETVTGAKVHMCRACFRCMIRIRGASDVPAFAVCLLDRFVPSLGML